MDRFNRFCLFVLPALVWAALIYAGSTDALSGQNTSKYIGPLLRWLIGGISDGTVHAVQLSIRKAAHLSEYAVLAILLWRALRAFGGTGPGPWRWPEAGMALALAALYAVSDEWHQSRVPSRYGSAVDVLIDTCGAVLGLLAAFTFCRWRERKSGSRIQGPAESQGFHAANLK